MPEWGPSAYPPTALGIGQLGRGLPRWSGTAKLAPADLLASLRSPAGAAVVIREQADPHRSRAAARSGSGAVAGVVLRFHPTAVRQATPGRGPETGPDRPHLPGRTQPNVCTGPARGVRACLHCRSATAHGRRSISNGHILLRQQSKGDAAALVISTAERCRPEPLCGSRLTRGRSLVGIGLRSHLHRAGLTGVPGPTGLRWVGTRWRRLARGGASLPLEHRRERTSRILGRRLDRPAAGHQRASLT